MSLVSAVAQSGDTTGGQLLDEYNRALAEASTMEFAGREVTWLRVTVGYRLRGYDGVLTEKPMQNVPPSAIPALQKLAAYVRCEWEALFIVADTGNEAHGRHVVAHRDDVLFIEIRTAPMQPEQTQDDQRRAKLRGGGRVAPLPVPPDGFAQLPETD